MTDSIEVAQPTEELLTVSWRAMQGNLYRLRPTPAMLKPEGEIIKLKVQLKGMSKTGENVSLIRFDREYVLEHLSRYCIDTLRGLSEKEILEIFKEAMRYSAAHRTAIGGEPEPEWKKYVIS